MSEAHAIWADSLTKTYRSGASRVSVFTGLSLRVPPGERLAIIGASGAGKSTLLHLLGGLDQPDHGTVSIVGQALQAFDRSQRADFQNRHIGFVWQNPSLLPEFSALENVMMPLLIRGIPVDSAAKQANERLREVGLQQRGAHAAGELSGGEQQRVALARALAAQPKILLADEPTGSLDRQTGDRISALLADLHASHRLTSVFVTHNLPFARRCDRVLELKNGQLQPSALADLQAVGVIEDATRLDGGTYV